MHYSRWMILLGAVVSLVSVPLTYLQTPVGTTSGLDGEGWPIVFFVALPVLLALTGDRAEGLRPALSLPAIISGALALLFAVTKVVDASRAADQVVAVAGEGSIGVGVWVLLAGALILVAGTAATLSRRVAGG